MAVLRYDKRTKVYPAKLDMKKLTVTEEVVEDALEAIEFLQKEKRIDPKGIYLLGHSLGGMLAPEIGVVSGKLAGVVIMAGNSRPLEDLVLEQYQYIFNLDGKTDSTEQKELDSIQEKVKKLKDGTLGDDEAFLFVKGFYWKDLKKRNQVDFVRKLECPILILQGGRDYQVTNQDFEGWKKGLKDKGSVTYNLYPDLNHLFMKGEGKCTPSEYEKEGHVEAKVIQDIAGWIKQ
jgi:dienelactone hydrolase